MYSQNQEEKYILEFFGNQTGTLLDIGANDGITFSNSYALLQKGWSGLLVEPSPEAFRKLYNLHGSKNPIVHICTCAIGSKDDTAVLHESGPHFPSKTDVALLSSLKKAETEKWKQSGVKFNEAVVNVNTYATLLKKFNNPVFDFISIDAEGMDLEILAQIDLTPTKLLCIEWNSHEATKHIIMEYCNRFGMNKIIYQSPENLLLAR